MKVKKLDWRNARSLRGKTIEKIITSQGTASGPYQATDICEIVFTDGTALTLNTLETESADGYMTEGTIYTPENRLFPESRDD